MPKSVPCRLPDYCAFNNIVNVVRGNVSTVVDEAGIHSNNDCYDTYGENRRGERKFERKRKEERQFIFKLIFIYSFFTRETMDGYTSCTLIGEDIKMVGTA